MCRNSLIAMRNAKSSGRRDVAQMEFNCRALLFTTSHIREYYGNKSYFSVRFTRNAIPSKQAAHVVWLLFDDDASATLPRIADNLGLGHCVCRK